jgi:DNA-binding winged helix-turn-helix (wHTH) protein/TolB-like protein/tetratricopeptide (TPR) repeat protein
MKVADQIAFEFGPFRLEPAERLLLRNGEVIPVTAKAFETLLVLVRRRGHLVEKSELMVAVWEGSFVEEGNIAVAVSMLRKVLGDEGKDHTYIQTIAKRGYRFIGEVRELTKSDPDFGLPQKPSPAPAKLLHLHGESLMLKVQIGILALGCFAITMAVVHARKTSAAQAEIHSLAVLPFRSLNSDPAYAQIGLGIADAIITRLGASGQIVVRPTNAIMKYANLPTDPLAIGHDQKVDAILVGNIETHSDRVRVTVQLVRVADGALLWAERFEDTPQQMFALEQDVEERVAQSMSVRLSAETTKNQTPLHIPDSKAYQLYVEGRYFWNKRTDEGMRRSIEYFQRATMEDQHYALAFAGLADSYTLLASYGVESAKQAYPNAKAAALKALDLDPSLAEAHTSLGMVSFYYEWNWPQAEDEFRRSIKLNPNYPLAHAWYALDLAAMGRQEESITQMRRAADLDDLSLSINTELGRVYYWNHQYDRSIAAYRKAIDLDPQFARAHTRLGITYAAQRHFADAISEFKQARSLSGPDPYLDGLLGFAQAFSGNAGAARKLLEELTERSQHEYVPAFSMALICIGLGERDLAFEWLAKSYQDRSTYMVWIKADPLFDSIRSDPRFTALVNQMGLQ